VNESFALVPFFAKLVLLTFRAPARAAEALIALNQPRVILWQAMFLVIVVSVLAVAMTQVPMPELAPDVPPPLVISPFSYALILGAALVMFVFALHYTGQSIGGKGTFQGALTLVIWIEVMSILVRLVEFAVLLVVPALDTLMMVLGIGLMIWIVVNFVNVLHRFDNLGKALLTIVLAVLGIGLGTAVILTLIGTAGGPLNV